MNREVLDGTDAELKVYHVSYKNIEECPDKTEVEHLDALILNSFEKQLGGT